MTRAWPHRTGRGGTESSSTRVTYTLYAYSLLLPFAARQRSLGIRRKIASCAGMFSAAAA